MTFLSPTLARITLNFCAGQALQGVQPPLAELCFNVASGQSSRLLQLQIVKTVARTVSGALLTSTKLVTKNIPIVGNQSVLQLAVGPDGTHTLTLAGKPGTTYSIEYTTDMRPPIAWTRLPPSVTLSGVTTNIPGVSPAPAQVYYRAVEGAAQSGKLTPSIAPGGKLRLTLEGTPGMTYTIQYAPGLVPPINWSNVTQITLTGPTGYVDIDPPPGTGIYRAIEAQANPAPTLQAQVTPSGDRRLFVRGLPSRQYSVEYSTNLSGPVFWHHLLDFTLTNDTGLVQLTNKLNPVFYRLKSP